MKIEEVAKYFTTGWIAMDAWGGGWYWHDKKPHTQEIVWGGSQFVLDLSDFDIPPVSDWKQSLVQIKNGKVVK